MAGWEYDWWLDSSIVCLFVCLSVYLSVSLASAAATDERQLRIFEMSAIFKDPSRELQLCIFEKNAIFKDSSRDTVVQCWLWTCDIDKCHSAWSNWYSFCTYKLGQSWHRISGGFREVAEGQSPNIEEKIDVICGKTRGGSAMYFWLFWLNQWGQC